MEDLTKFKNKIFLYGILVMLLMEVISLLFLGFNLKFSYGLLLGTAISIVNFNILAITITRVVTSGKKFLATISYLIRLIIYGTVFLIAIKTSNYAGIGCVLGFLTTKVAIFFIHGLQPGFKWVRKKKGGETAQAKRNILIKDPWRVRYAANKTISTHKRLMNYKKD